MKKLKKKKKKDHFRWRQLNIDLLITKKMGNHYNIYLPTIVGAHTCWPKNVLILRFIMRTIFVKILGFFLSLISLIIV